MAASKVGQWFLQDCLGWGLQPHAECAAGSPAHHGETIALAPLRRSAQDKLVRAQKASSRHKIKGQEQTTVIRRLQVWPCLRRRLWLGSSCRASWCLRGVELNCHSAGPHLNTVAWLSVLAQA